MRGKEAKTETPRRRAFSADELLTTIERDLIPRLVMAHRRGAPPRAVPTSPEKATDLPPTEAEIAAFVHVALTQDMAAAMRATDALTARGLSSEALLLNLIAPAARLLGEHWETDLHTFAEVTAGLGVLQGLVQTLGSSSTQKTGHRGLVVLGAAPGEQHTLGLFLLAELFQQAGWLVDLVPGLNQAELVSIVSHEHVEMVGLTVSSEKFFGPLGHLITALRRHSLSPRLRVVVGGSADLTSFSKEHRVPVLTDAHQAVEWLEHQVAGPFKALPVS